MATLLCDLDGVVWLALRPIDGAVEAIERWQRRGGDILYVTNNSVATIESHEAALDRIGIDASGRVVSSAVAAATLIEPGERVAVVGGPGVVEALEQRGAVIWPVDDAPDHVDAVVVGLDRDFTFARLERASTLIRDGARFVATNTDPTFPTSHGPTPGAGALVAAVATAAGTAPLVAGKPHAAMARAVIDLATSGAPSRETIDEMIMVGDRLDTDGAFAAELGVPFALVRSGVTTPQDQVTADAAAAAGAEIHHDHPHLAGLVDQLLGAW